MELHVWRKGHKKGRNNLKRHRDPYYGEWEEIVKKGEKEEGERDNGKKNEKEKSERKKEQREGG